MINYPILPILAVPMLVIVIKEVARIDTVAVEEKTNKSSLQFDAGRNIPVTLLPTVVPAVIDPDTYTVTGDVVPDTAIAVVESDR